MKRDKNNQPLESSVKASIFLELPRLNRLDIVKICSTVLEVMKNFVTEARKYYPKSQ